MKAREEQNARDQQNQLARQHFQDHSPVASKEGEKNCVANVETTVILSHNKTEDTEPVAGELLAGTIRENLAKDTNPNVWTAKASNVPSQKEFPDHTRARGYHGQS